MTVAFMTETGDVVEAEPVAPPAPKRKFIPLALVLTAAILGGIVGHSMGVAESAPVPAAIVTGTESQLLPQAVVDALPACTEEDGSSGPNPCGWNQGATPGSDVCSFAVVGSTFYYTTAGCRDQ